MRNKCIAIYDFMFPAIAIRHAHSMPIYTAFLAACVYGMPTTCLYGMLTTCLQHAYDMPTTCL